MKLRKIKETIIERDDLARKKKVYLGVHFNKMIEETYGKRRLLL